jgi:hypothetical protein
VLRLLVFHSEGLDQRFLFVGPGQRFDCRCLIRGAGSAF